MSIELTTRPQPSDMPANPQATRALRHVLGRVQKDRRVAHLIGPGSQSFDLMTEALAALTGEPVETLRATYGVPHERT